MLILASKSPRRKELLSSLGLKFSCCPAQGEEVVPENVSPEVAVAAISAAKAEEVLSRFADDVVLSADTVVVLENQILGKPKDEADAKRMLKILSGQVHKVLTAVTILWGNHKESFVEETQVEFYTLSQREIEEYVLTKEPMDKAGAYGIQGKGALLVKRINGDYFNVVGLPVAKVWRKLSDIKQYREF